MMNRGAAMRRHLEELRALRGSDAQAPARLAELKAFQAERLSRSYADLAAQPRYRAATGFFLGDLYGPKDFSRRDASMLRVLPAMTRMMPASAVETAMLATELEALSEALDHAAAGALPAGPLDDRAYGEAYRESSTRENRVRQIDRYSAARVRCPFVFASASSIRRRSTCSRILSSNSWRVNASLSFAQGT